MSPLFGPSPSAYERFIHDCMIGDATLYNRADSIEAAWQAETWIEDEGRYWRKL